MSLRQWAPQRISRALYWRSRAALDAVRKKTSERSLAALAPRIAFMARTGVGTDACLASGALPMPVHFYSPVPDIKDLKKRNIWSRRSNMAGIDFQPERQLAFMAEIGAKFGDECQWSHEPHDSLSFHTNNSGFSYGCASVLYSMIRYCNPHNVIEVGSGNSTRVIAQALRRNRAESGVGEFIVVDPYPSEDTQRVPGIDRFIVERVELLDESIFDLLGANDILFVDSGHTVRAGGDVNYLILDILPRLKPGVVVHFHDIPMPFEYNETYFTNPSFRMFWTESYLLQAFLSLNDKYETLLAMSWIMADQRDAFAAAFRYFDAKIHINSSSSYWIRRIR